MGATGRFFAAIESWQIEVGVERLAGLRDMRIWNEKKPGPRAQKSALTLHLKPAAQAGEPMTTQGEALL